MRRILIALMFTLVCAPITRADIATFENLNPGTDATNANAGAGGYFVSGGLAFNNVYDPNFSALVYGWAISSATNNTLPASFTRPYVATPGSGDGSATYAVAYTFSNNLSTPDELRHPNGSFVNLPVGMNPLSMRVTNTTYAYSIIAFGDPNNFARKFGAGDFFTLDVTGYDALGGVGNVLGTVFFDLANFRDGNSLIVNNWQSVDLSSLLGAKSLRFGLRSSDNGAFGMNTPAYFALDNLALTAVPEPASLALLALGTLGGLALARSRHRCG